jgi:hypothetical protein
MKHTAISKKDLNKNTRSEIFIVSLGIDQDYNVDDLNYEDFLLNDNQSENISSTGSTCFSASCSSRASGSRVNRYCGHWFYKIRKPQRAD